MEKLKEVNKLAAQEIKDSFRELQEAIAKYDPIKLLSQLHLTYLIVPEDTFYGEDSDQAEWLHKIEFLTGLYLSKTYPKDTKPLVDGKDLEVIEKALDKYFKSITTDLLTSGSLIENEEDKAIESILKTAKLYSFYVHGESYQHQLIDIAKYVYSAHDDWFKKKLGFTIIEAISISESITEEYNNRINVEKVLSLKKATEYIEQELKSGKTLKDKKQLLTQVGCFYFFGESDRILSFTLKELVKFSGHSRVVCKAFLNRLSQEFGYKNSRFPNTFKEGNTAPWDYNTIYEKPIIAYKDKYYVPLPSLFSEVLFDTFYYDLILDEQYWKFGGGKKYGNTLEHKTADYLKRIFPEDSIILNPQYPNGEELCDVLVLYDRNVLIFQDKTKRLSYESFIGQDIEKVKEDIKKGIRSAFDQAIKAQKYFQSNNPAKIKVKKGNVIIDTKQISSFFPISVTLESYQNLATRFSNTNDILQVFEKERYPWSVSLSDLGTITELIESPARFIHYIIRRLQVEKTSFLLFADEIDLLGLYLSRGLFLETGEFTESSGVSFSGFSEEIDNYIFAKHETSLKTIKPTQKSPDGFDEFLKELSELNIAYRTDCAIKLLELSYAGRKNFIETVTTLKERVNKGKSLESLSFTIDDKSVGFCFVGMAADGDLEKLYQQTFSFAVMKKYMTKSKDWVAFGWDKDSKKLVDLALFLSYSWKEDKEIEKISKESLKVGKMLKF